MSNRLVPIVALVMVTALGVGHLSAQSGYDLFQKALAAERADGNLRQAIQLYARVVSEFAGDRALVARALLRMADCYEKLGGPESQAIYERITREFVEQTDSTAIARARLAAFRERRTRGGAPGIVTRQVWTGPGVDTLGSISPDGRAISFVDWETGDLAIRNVASGTNRRLTAKGSWESPEFALFSRISPDGRLVAYNWMKKNLGWEMRVGTADGSPYRTPSSTDSNNDYAHPEAWSPDGRSLVALVSGEINQMALISVADGSRRILKSFDWRSPGHMVFSPDGKYIAYDFQPVEQSPERDIFVLAVDGTREIRVVDHPADDYLLGWLSDGRLVFASDRAGTADAWTLRVTNGAAAGAAELLKKDLGHVISLGLTLDAALYYGLRASGTEVYTMPLDVRTRQVTGAPTRMPQRFIGTNVDPEWSPDGRRLAYVSERDVPPNRIGSQVLCILDIGSGIQRELPIKLAYISRPRWSPDGRSLVFRANDERGRVSFFVADADTGVVRLLVRRPGLQHAVWSADGRRVFVLTTDAAAEAPAGSGQTSWIVARDVTTGAETELFRETTTVPAGDAFVNNLALSADGGRLAFTVRRGRTKVVLVLPTAGGPARQIFTATTDFEPTNFGGLAWTPDGREILVVRAGGASGEELWALPSEGGAPRPLGLRLAGLRRPAIHPDGRQIAFQSGTRAWEVWALENLPRRVR